LTESKPKVSVQASAVTPGWLAAYVPDARRYDELLDEKGLIRPHWQPLLDQLTGDDARAVARRGLERTRRLIVENGVTYNVYADPQGADRPWALDPVPLLLLADEWRAIEVGLAQRARLLDAMLADIYGPQRLLSEGLVPPELVFGHPNFLWPCQGIVPRGGNWLHVYAADLARAPDGRWWLLADRTQAPSGAGYALENREIVEQVLPEAIRQLEVKRVTGVFSELREQLLHASPSYFPEILPFDKLKEGTIIDNPGAAFRSNWEWYDLSYRCEVDADATKVVSFAFDVGSPLMPGEWKRRGLPAQ